MLVLVTSAGLVTSARERKSDSETEPNGVRRVVITLASGLKSDDPARIETILPYYNTSICLPSATISQTAFPRACFFDTKPCASMRMGTRELGAGTLMVRILQISGRMEASEMNVVQLA
jgi:hypothetical protein